jgi:hypothetical protein
MRLPTRNRDSHTHSQCVFSFPLLIVVPLSSLEVDGVRKEKERLTAAINYFDWMVQCAHDMAVFLM